LRVDVLVALRERSVTPGQFFLQYCDGKLTDEDFNDQGNAFTVLYFDSEKGQFLADYEAILATNQPSLYHVPDTWHTYEVLKPVLDRRFSQWRANGG
jgi:hypothetical protein